MYKAAQRLMECGRSDDEILILTDEYPFAGKFVDRCDIEKEIGRERKKWIQRGSPVYVFEPEPEPANDNHKGEDDPAAKIVAEINRKHAFVLVQGQATIINNEGKGRFSYSREKDFISWYANKYMPKKEDEEKPKSVARYWLQGLQAAAIPGDRV